MVILHRGKQGLRPSRSLEATSQLLSGDGEDNGSCRDDVPVTCGSCSCVTDLKLGCQRIVFFFLFSIQLGKEHILTRQLMAVVNERDYHLW